LDIHDKVAVDALIGDRKGSCIINCAAYTAVDAAETDATTAWQTNARGPELLAMAAARAAIPLIHVSTDFVFDGTLHRPYRPSDLPRPINIYGHTKAAGEDAIRRAAPRHAILRTSWVVSPFGKNFVRTILGKVQQSQQLRVVSDQFGRPTSALDLAGAIQTIAMHLLQDPRHAGGTFHFANAGRVSWHELALAISEAAHRRGLPKTQVEPVTTEQYPTAARRPRNSELCTAGISAFGITPRPWQTALEEIMDALTAR
jgi:dTDP-4-dehydrorhamnose reductase